VSRLNFKLEAEASGSRARAARFMTLHGEVQTPIFMPVGTQATVKSQTVESLKTTGSNVLLANTYHLLLRPGPEVLKKFGGIHRFMNWDRPVLTDSGGFQIFSLPHSRQMNENGAVFQSYVDKTSILLSPELSIQTQRAIGSDIMMVLDQCIPSTSPHDQAKAAMELTHRWAKRSLLAREDSPQALFAIVQGACFPDLRKQSAEFLSALEIGGVGFDGIAVGGLAVGESKSEREDFTELAVSFLPKNLPRYLMGVGTPSDILEAVHRGIDMFDCILPSQLAQRGVAFTSAGKLQLRRSVYKFSEAKLDPNCECSTCITYSRAYLHHLNKTEEVLGWHLIALHNFSFYHRLMREIRESILRDEFLSYYQTKRLELLKTDEEHPSTPFVGAKPSRAEKRKRLGDYEVHTSPHGFSSIRQISSGEIMHSVTPPEVEATELYVKPAKLSEKLKAQKTLVIWDGGLGAATNAMMTLNELIGQYEANPDLSCETAIVSFENDLDPLKLAMRHTALFPSLRHPGPAALLEKKEWNHPLYPIQWKLVAGDFLETIANTQPIPDLIYYDFFSSKMGNQFWTKDAFQKLKRVCEKKPMQLITYSASTLVRGLFLREGFWVAYGKAAGPKASTTTVFNDEALARAHGELLGAEWLARWARSGAQFPENLNEAEKLSYEQTIRNHPQFSL
jgi:queuine tRNA-ribosyltransferase